MKIETIPLLFTLSCCCLAHGFEVQNIGLVPSKIEGRIESNGTDDSSQAMYKSKQDRFCGVAEVKSFVRPECGAKTYNSCRSPRNRVVYDLITNPFPIKESSVVWHPLVSKEEGLKMCRKVRPLGYQIESQVNERQKSPDNKKWLITDINIEVKESVAVCGRGRGRGVGDNEACPVISPAYRCLYTLQEKGLLHEEAPDVLCGVQEYKSCDEVIYRSCRHESFGVDKEAIASINDKIYFKVVMENLRRFPRIHDNPIQWENLRAFIEESSLRGRTIPFEIMADLRTMINAIAPSLTETPIQREFKTYFTFLMVDYYLRVSSHYNNQRTKDILSLEALAFEIKKKMPVQVNAIQILKERIQTLNLSKAMTAAILSSLESAERRDSDRLLSLIKDISAVIKNGIYSNKKDAANLVGRLESQEPLFEFNGIHVSLNAGQFDQAQLKMIDAHSYFKKRPRLSIPVGGDWFYQALMENVKARSVRDLEVVSLLFDIIDSTGEIPSTFVDPEGKEVPLPASVLSILDEAQVITGKSLDGTKFQLLDLLERNLIHPLDSFIKNMGASL